METAMLFMIACVALAFAPGPDNLFVLTQSALYGRRAGLLVTAGLCTGLIVHTAAVALGIAAIFQTSVFAFNALKIVGAIYLLYLALQVFRVGATELSEGEQTELTGDKLYLRGIIMNVTNPKVAIFFLAFLPQFVNPVVGNVTAQISLLGFLFIVSTWLVFSFIAWFSGYLGGWLKKSARAQVVMSRIAGMVFIALAVRLLVSEL